MFAVWAAGRLNSSTRLIVRVGFGFVEAVFPNWVETLRSLWTVSKRRHFFFTALIVDQFHLRHSNTPGAPLEDFRCLSALPKGTWTVDDPYLSVLWSRDSNQQLYAHPSSHVVVPPSCWFGFSLEVTQKQRVRYLLRLKTEERQNDEKFQHFFIWNLKCSVFIPTSGDAQPDVNVTKRWESLH